jgi:hypothetical protein
MNDKSRSIGIACAIGAFAGALAALKIAQWFAIGQYLWIIGACLGGIVDYLAYEPKHIWVAIKETWREKAAVVSRHPRYLRNMWRRFARNAPLCFWLGAFIGFGFFWGLFILDAIAGFSGGFQTLLCLLIICAIILVFFFALLLLMSMVHNPLVQKSRPNQYCIQTAREVNQVIRKAILLYNPLVALVWWLPQGLWWVAPKVWRIAIAKKTYRPVVVGAWQAARWCWDFACAVFTLIHSDERLICLADSMMGAAVGYLWSSPVVGAIIGAILGVLNYEIVSVRWLKLVPGRK